MQLKTKLYYDVLFTAVVHVFCHLATSIRDFRSRSFIEWDFQDRFYEALSRSSHRTDIQLTFRTRRDSGLLFKAQNAQKSEYLVLEVSRSRQQTKFIHDRTEVERMTVEGNEYICLNANLISAHEC